MDQRHKDVLKQGDELFGKRRQVDTLWQEIADNFYPERAQFTVSASLGEDFAGGLDTSYPILACRDLGNAFSAMLRPPEKEWFHIGLKRAERLDEAGRQWLEMAGRVQRRAMYDRLSGFVRATKEGDYDFAAFGQAVLSAEISTTPEDGAILLHRCWHLRDVAWREDSFGRVRTVHRQWNPTAMELSKIFPGKIHGSVTSALKTDPYREFRCRHVILPAAEYDTSKTTDRQPFVSLYIDLENEHVIEEKRIWNRFYVIPRWQTVSGSQYAYSPATVAALPDARLIQAMTYTLLTAGENIVNPPLIGVSEAIKSGIEAFPGGFTARDGTYDERLGEVIKPLFTPGEKALPTGMEMLRDTRAMIAEAFFLNRLAMPPPANREMTAFEVAKRIEEYVRAAAPLFEPMEWEYNGGLCELGFDLLMRAGAFGPLSAMPESIRGQDVEFRFESPIREAADRIKGQQFLEAKSLLVEAAPLDPLSVQMVDARIALRDALRGVGTPAKWLRDEEKMAEIEETEKQAKAAQELMGSVQVGAQIAEQVGKAGRALSPEPAAAPTRAA